MEKLPGSRPLPSCVVSFLETAFLGEMVVGHKNSKVIKPPFHERIMRTFAEITDTAGKRVCKNILYNIFINMLPTFPENRVF